MRRRAGEAYRGIKSVAMDSEDPYSQTSTNKPDFVDKVETLSAVQQH